MNKLNDAKIRAAIREAKGTGKPIKIFDGRGLYGIAQPSGVLYWRFKYRLKRREKGLSLGVYPDVSLKRAREKREDMRELVAHGTDPSAVRKAEKTAQDFETLAREWLDKQSGLAESTRKLAQSRLERHVFPYIGTQSVQQLQTQSPEILRVLRRLEDAGKHQTRIKVTQRISQVFRYAVATGRAERDPTADLKGAFAPVTSKSHAAITDPVEVGKLLRAIDTYKGQSATGAALKLMPLLFTRPGEMRQATWDEIDLENAIRRIPPRRMKLDRDHLVPLSAQAVAILTGLKDITGNRSYVFESLRPGRPLSENTLCYALRALGYSGDVMVAHGFRVTASTLLHELGYPPEVIELQLAHKTPGVAGIYNRSARLEERKEMMQAWADYLDVLKQGASVVPLRRDVS